MADKYIVSFVNSKIGISPKTGIANYGVEGHTIKVHVITPHGLVIVDVARENVISMIPLKGHDGKKTHNA